MKLLYLDCSMGAAGDMLAAALSQLVPNPEEVLDRINSLSIPGLKVSLEKNVKCGLLGMHYNVEIVEHDGHGRHLADVEDIIDGSNAPEKVRNDAKAVYHMLAEAESKVHGCAIDNIHFHEVGTIDAIADILSVCMLIHELAPERICASDVHVGTGTVKCAHGVLPVPAPATAELLKGVPIYGGDVEGELCTPTGAALLRYFVDEFGAMPHMTVDNIGYGMGKKDFSRPNCLRAIIGESADEVTELCCNVDDMSGEEIGYALEKLMQLGALDAYWEPIGMKKSRPGMHLGVICRMSERDSMVGHIFRLTSTIGIRESVCRRYVLRRGERVEQTEWGSVRYKDSEGFGVRRSKAEFDDLRALADSLGMSPREISNILKSID